MTTDRPDLPTFTDRDVCQHAEAVRAVNHITGWPTGLTDPSDAYTVLNDLARAVAMLPQACEQIQRRVSGWHTAGHIGIDPDTTYTGNPAAAVLATLTALDETASLAVRLYAALDRATQPMVGAHRLGPRPGHRGRPVTARPAPSAAGEP